MPLLREDLKIATWNLIESINVRFSFTEIGFDLISEFDFREATL